ncbi:winged helix-turn-helix transcriptional regulator [Desulfatitalea alkaliphila]|uniref:Winged helix-turn-helix transcriptional regulator n=1 Tax=Desulfatitalea alkaliphila TaxID=2929485 RepID=A0AA41UIY0_9BACT|nr:winged helix-turn-helix transcriptional regulator [Desulfatitalea alkaliphila]MCJ8501255.1 winged helix-turn-helix transcriptional regulator [Desulfatitalea alkaliphila]
MKLRDIRTLTLLQEMDKENPPTQRELAERLDVSLGLVNLYIKQLVQKSYFKIRTYPRNRVGYLLTPKGLLEKTRLTCDFIQHSLDFYRMAKSKLENTLKQLEQEGVRTIVLYGSNEIAEIAYLALKQTNLELAAVIDDEKAGQLFLGQTVIPASALIDLHFDRLLDTRIPPEGGKYKPLPVPRKKQVPMIQY